MNGHILCIALYVDDLLISSCNLEAIGKVKSLLSKTFEMKDLGEVQSVLGLQLSYDMASRVMKISQSNAIGKVLERFGMAKSKPITTPMEKVPSLADEGECSVSVTEYRSAIGSLMYIMMGTRPDLSYSLGHWSQFLENHSEQHWKGVKRIFRYLKGSQGASLI